MTDDFDRAQEVEQRDRDLAIAAHAASRSERIQQGNRRPDCIDCGAPIGKKRLRAVPETNHCIDCASEAELKARRTRRGR